MNPFDLDTPEYAEWERQESAEGPALLDEVETFIRRYCALPSDAAYAAVTLWAGHTHLADRFDSTPRLALLSAEKQSGKTRTLEILELLCVGAEVLSDASPAFMFRRIDAGAVTVLLDECDAIWKRAKGDESAEALRSIVNAGHRKRATVGRVEMNGRKGELMRYRVYAPVALAGIGDLPDTILDRAVIIRMRRRAPDELIEQYRERTARPEGERLAGDLAAWAVQHEHRIGDPWPDMPAGVADRPADVWEPLLAVAEAVGGDWPKRAREACVAFVSGARGDTASLGQRLLGDVRRVFDGTDVELKPNETSVACDVIASAELCRRLTAIEEAPWADMYGKPIDARRLAKMLGQYQVSSTKVRIGESSVRGYRREDLHDMWRRYLSPGNGTDGTSGTPLASHVPDVPSVPDLEPFPDWATAAYERER